MLDQLSTLVAKPMSSTSLTINGDYTDYKKRFELSLAVGYLYTFHSVMIMMVIIIMTVMETMMMMMVIMI